MKTFVLCLLLYFVVPPVPVQNPTLSSLVETERAFSRAAAEKNTREAFLAFIADDGILFRPNAVNGRKWMQENPMPTSTKHPLLSWQPIFADLSQAGDLGYTTGPWEYKEDINDREPVAYGNFVTVWKRQSDRSWKFVIDLGISNPRPNVATSYREPKGKEQAKKSKFKIDLNAQRAGLLDQERNFSIASRKDGFAKAFAFYAAPAVRLYRNDKFPFVGSAAAEQELAAHKAVLTWEPTFADVSNSGDLGYAYGLYELSDDSNAIVERGNYLRIWKKENGNWRVVLDVANPLPPKKD